MNSLQTLSFTQSTPQCGQARIFLRAEPLVSRTINKGDSISFYWCITNCCKLSDLKQHTCITHSFYEAGDQVWLSWSMALSLQRGRQDCVIWRLDLGTISLWAPSDCWQNSFLCGCKTDGFSLLLKPVLTS